ncbi:MAG: hypothetical protein ACLS5Z_04885 [Clostridium fessum]
MRDRADYNKGTMQFKVRFRTAFDDSARKEGICDSQKYPGIYEIS